MSKIISLSVDDAFANGLEHLMKASGYANRSRFLRDAALAFAPRNNHLMGEQFLI